MKKQTILIFLLAIIFQGKSQFFEPFSYQLTDSTLKIAMSDQDRLEKEIALFERNFIWIGQIPNSEFVAKMTIRHDAIYLNSDAALESHNRIYVPVGENDSLHRLEVRIIENGKVIRTQGKADIREIKEEESTFKIIAVEGLKKGQILETLIVRMSSYSEGGTIQLQRSYPVKRSEVCINGPSNIRFAIKVYPKPVEVADTVVGDEKRFQHFTILDLKAIVEEDYLFEAARKVRAEYTLERNFAQGKKFNQWADKGRNTLENLMKSSSAEKKFIKKLVKQENWAELSGLAQLFAIENKLKGEFNVSKSYQHVADVEKNFKMRYVDEYSMLRIYTMIFQELKIEWELIFTVWKGKKFFDPDFPTNTYLEDPLFYFPTYKIYTDPVDKSFRPGDIGALYRDQYAMFVRPILIGEEYSGVTKIAKIPSLPMDSVVREHNILVTWNPDEEEVNIKTRFSGNRYANDGQKVLFELIGEEKTKEVIEENVRHGKKGGTFTVKQIQNAKVSDVETYGRPLIIDYDWKTTEYTENTGDRMIIRFGELIGPQVQMYDKETRFNPIDVAFPHIAIHEVRIRVPEGHTAKGYEGLNRDLAFKSESGEDLCGIKVEVFLEGNEVVMKIREFYAKTEYSISDYPVFRQVINAAADINKFTLLLQKNK